MNHIMLAANPVIFRGVFYQRFLKIDVYVINKEKLLGVWQLETVKMGVLNLLSNCAFGEKQQ